MNKALEFAFEDLKKSNLASEDKIEEIINLIKSEPNKVIEISSFDEDDPMHSGSSSVTVYSKGKQIQILYLDYLKDSLNSYYFDELYFVKEDEKFLEFKKLVFELFDINSLINSIPSSVLCEVSHIRLDKEGKVYYNSFTIECSLYFYNDEIDVLVSDFVKCFYKDYIHLYGNDHYKLHDIVNEGHVLFSAKDSSKKDSNRKALSKRERFK